METRGIHLPGNQEAHVKEWNVRAPQGDEVLIKVKAAALCASDMSIYKGNPLIPGYPSGTFIVGHEPCGIVAQAGPDVRGLREGDRVAVIAFTSCGACDYCRTGEPMLCAEMGVIGFTDHGGDADYLVVPERMCLPLPDAVSDLVGAISTDVLGNLYSTMNEIALTADDLVAIAGCGPMGLAGVLAAAARGATVVAIDPIASRREKAVELGAQHTINPEDGDPEEAIKQISPRGVDKAVDCSATNAGINTVLNIAGNHGIVAQIGEPGDKPISINPSEQLIRKKLTYIGSWYFKLTEWDEITDFMTAVGNEKAEQIVSHTYPLEEGAADEAFRLFSEHKTLKVVFTP